jgi:arabinogalactan endo-1,4-beta-galactosidase
MSASKPPVLGADISMLKQLVDHGAVYTRNGIPSPPLTLLKESGFSCARLRLFHTPSGVGAQVNDLAYTRDLAMRCVEAGLDVMLCLHYSDTWADPGKQHVPKAWRGMDFKRLVLAVYEYTRHVVADLSEHGCTPKIVQIGNEITPGLLWDHGRISHAHQTNDPGWSEADFAKESSAWRRFSNLLKAGVRGVRHGSKGRSDIMLHIDQGGNHRAAGAFFEAIQAWDVPFDAIGLSYYPFWHGSIADLKQTIQRLRDTFSKRLYVVETAFPYKSHAAYSDSPDRAADAASFGIPPTRPVSYPISPEGQRRFVADLLKLLRHDDVPSLDGLFYWAPEWVPLETYNDEPDASTCWPRALFDETGEALPALDEFARFTAKASRLTSLT